MEQDQQYLRRAAAKKFQESLNQLEGILQENPTEEEIPPESPSSRSEPILSENSVLDDLEALEEAVVDIEQYLEQKTKKNQP